MKIKYLKNRSKEASQFKKRFTVTSISFGKEGIALFIRPSQKNSLPQKTKTYKI
jgi:hypothetical protein